MRNVYNILIQMEQTINNKSDRKGYNEVEDLLAPGWLMTFPSNRSRLLSFFIDMFLKVVNNKMSNTIDRGSVVNQ